METIDFDNLTQLIGILRESGVTEFRSGDLHLVLGPPRPPSVNDVDYVPPQTRTKRSNYAALFNGRTPSFDDFKSAGLVTEE